MGCGIEFTGRVKKGRKKEGELMSVVLLRVFVVFPLFYRVKLSRIRQGHSQPASSRSRRFYLIADLSTDIYRFCYQVVSAV